MPSAAGPRLDPVNADARYRQDRAACFEGRSQQDTRTCLQEASAALQAARQRDLVSTEATQLAANARKRCEALSEGDKQDCIARLNEQTTPASGSVASGGILRETTTIQPSQTQPPGSTSTPDSAASR